MQTELEAHLMDILTHAGIGLIAATHLLNSHPELAIGAAAGSVLPDLDALGRLFSKPPLMILNSSWMLTRT